MSYDIIEFPEEGDPKSSNQREFPSLKNGRGQMVSTKSDYGVKSKRSLWVKYNDHDNFDPASRQLAKPDRQDYCLF